MVKHSTADDSRALSGGTLGFLLYHLMVLHGEDLHHHVGKAFTLIVIAPHDFLEPGIYYCEFVQCLHADERV